MLKVFLICFALFASVRLTDISFYEILGVQKQASTQEIRQAYKKLAIIFHPDKNPDKTDKEKFLKITEAYETLKDADKRRKYDLYGMYPSYSRKYDYKSQTEYDNLFYNGLYHQDPYVDTLSGKKFYSYLNEGFYFINFYSPFCPPCQSVSEHWKKLAEMYKGIMKVGAVNCKYHNSFCYNSMRIGSYPTLLFYPNGKHGSYVYYQGERTVDAMDDFVMMYLRSKAHVPTVAQLRGTDRPIAYVLGKNRIDKNALTRIAYRLNGLVTVAVVEDEDLRQKLTKDDYATVVFKYKEITKDIESVDEKEVLKTIVEQLPKIELVDPDRLKSIRNKLRAGSDEPWVLFFSTKDCDRLELHQTRTSMPNINFGEIDCDTWAELCASLQGEVGAWGVLKRGGAYQLVDRSAIATAVEATNLHTLTASELARILDAGTGVWILLVAPYGTSWEHLADAFTRASVHFIDDNSISFGIVPCAAGADRPCRRVGGEPTVLAVNGTRRSHRAAAEPGGLQAQHVVQFVQMLKDSADMELNESQVLEILDPSSRSFAWLVAHFPAGCGAACHRLAGEWMKIYKKLKALDFVRVGILNCEGVAGGFCTNIRSPTARLYPISSGHHYSLDLHRVNEASNILEWALSRIDTSVQTFEWDSFTRAVGGKLAGNEKPWLVYFHSPRCYRCHEMYPDFAIAGILLNARLGKVNCLTERGVCQHERITRYPSLRLYSRRAIDVPVREYLHIVEDVTPHLATLKRDEL